MENLSKRLADRVCLVTGASRGVGKGIALALGSEGATVYITGRSVREKDNPVGGTVSATAEEVTRRGGRGIAIACDHSDDAQVRAVFERIGKEAGRLDILVNNACAIPDRLAEAGPFWSKPLDLVQILDVGMRSNYVATYFAAPLLNRHGGLVVNISSPGARCYLHGPAYGAGKAAVDKMAHDMAHDFKPYGVVAVSMWPGFVKTERVMQGIASQPNHRYAPFVAMGESPEFTGRVIAALFADPERMIISGQVHIVAELAQRYGVKDIDGAERASHRAFLGGPTEFSSVVIE
jgi:NAD(P)-dependent dehydrogenase (short-subunit alcohol dehydrogenase family)